MPPVINKNTVATTSPVAVVKTAPQNESQAQHFIQFQNQLQIQPEVDTQSSATVLFVLSTGEQHILKFDAPRKCCNVQELLHLAGIPFTHNTRIECIPYPRPNVNNIDYIINVGVTALEPTSEIGKADENSLQMNTGQTTISQNDQQSAIEQQHSTQKLTTPGDNTDLFKGEVPPPEACGYCGYDGAKCEIYAVLTNEPKRVRFSNILTIRKVKPYAREQIEAEPVIIISSSDDENDNNKSNRQFLKKQSDAKQPNFTHQLTPPHDKNFASSNVDKRVSLAYATGLLALCNACGHCGYDHFKCERCTRVFVEKPDLIPYPDNAAAELSDDNSDDFDTNIESTVPQLSSQFPNAVENSLQLNKSQETHSQIYHQSVFEQPHSNQQLTSPGDKPCASMKLAVQPKYVSGFLAVCRKCGYYGYDHAECDRCRRVFSEEPERIPAAKDNTLEDENKRELYITQNSTGEIGTRQCSPGVTATAGQCQPPTRDKPEEDELVILILSSDEEGDDDKAKPEGGPLKQLTPPGNETEASTKVSKDVPSKYATGFLAACNLCGYYGSDHFKCERCQQEFKGEPKRIPYLKSNAAKVSKMKKTRKY